MGDLKGSLGPHAVHLCVDMQRLFSEEGPWPTPWLARVLPSVVRLVERAPERTVFTQFVTPRSAADMPGLWQAYYRKWANTTREHLDERLLELVPALQRYAPPATVFDKMVYSAFATGELHVFLRQHDVDTLVVTGSETDVCVLSSVLSAVDHGYRVVVTRDAICSSSDLAHDAMMDLYTTRFDLQIELASVDEILALWPL